MSVSSGGGGSLGQLHRDSSEGSWRRARRYRRKTYTPTPNEKTIGMTAISRPPQNIPSTNGSLLPMYLFPAHRKSCQENSAATCVSEFLERVPHHSWMTVSMRIAMRGNGMNANSQSFFVSKRRCM